MERVSDRLKKVAAGVFAAAMVSSVAFGSIAYADPVGTVTNDGTTGSSDLYIKINDLTERETPAENVNFSVPSRIDYVAEADGDVFGPTNAYIENLSAYKAFTSHYTAEAKNGWNIVTDASKVGDGVRNAITINLGPTADKRNIAEGGTDNAVDNNSSETGKQKAIKNGETGSKVALPGDKGWDMLAHGFETSYTSDQVALVTDGSIKNVDNNINDYTRDDSKFGTINWFITPGTRV